MSARMAPAAFLDAVRGRRICVRVARLHTPVEVPIETALAVWDACGGRVKVLQRGSLAVLMAEPPDRKYRVAPYRGADPLDPRARVTVGVDPARGKDCTGAAP